MTALSMRGLRVGYGSDLVFDGVDLDIPSKRFVAVVGPNGGGKSTLLRASVGLLASTGEIRVLDQPWESVRTRVAFVPQRDTTTPQFPITVRQVVAMGRYPHRGWWRRLTAADHDVIDAALHAAGITDLDRSEIDQLSGGQRRRVFLARALAQQPDLYLLDEPFAGVDAATEASLTDVLKTLVDQGRSVVVVHHRLDQVATHFDHAVLVAGRIVASGHPQTTITASNLAAAHGLDTSVSP